MENEKLTSWLPFDGYADLEKKCKAILAALKEYGEAHKETLRERSIPFSDFDGLIGVAINLDSITPEQKEWILSGNDEWAAFTTAFVNKFKINDPSKRLSCS